MKQIPHTLFSRHPTERLVGYGIGVVLTVWPGASAERVEQLVTKKVEEKIGENSKVTEIKSISVGY